MPRKTRVPSGTANQTARRFNEAAARCRGKPVAGAVVPKFGLALQ